MTEQPLWQPSEQQVALTNLSRFQAFAGKQDLGYQALWKWSVTQPSEFWESIWRFTDVISHSKYDPVLVKEGQMPGAEWFPGATLNFAENLLKRRDGKKALVACDEQGHRVSLTYEALYLKVAQLASSLRAIGVRKGDRVAGFMPNVAESVIAMLATSSIGAVWSSCSPDFGLQGVLDRFGQIEPKVLITTDGYYYGGKTLDSLDRVKQITDHLTSVAKVLVVSYVTIQADLSELPGCAQHWDDFLDPAAKEVQFEPVPFDHPLYIMYSSGTTGVPKCMVHGVGGTLLQHAKELILHTDVSSDDTVFYYTTCGWMMWNWLVSSLMTGATVVLFDGSPFYPGPEVLWDLAEHEKISVFGTSAKYIAALEKSGLKPTESHDLSALKAVLSTGSPLAHESFDYVYRDIKADLCLSSISGGTDIISCFALGCPTLPVWRGELQCLGLGMNVSIFNDQGQTVYGEKGELVCLTPFPSMPVQFWNDPDGQKFHDAYFGRWPGIWAHGDYGELTTHLPASLTAEPNHGVIIHGRSDAVLNPGGVRIGTAEIYRQVERVNAVVDSIAVGQQWQDDVRVVLFVVLREGVTLDETLIHEIKHVIRQNTTPRHVPAKVIQVADIPRTISGKIVELAVRNVIHGEPVKNTDALKNPEALDYFKNLSELTD
ncbi:acetoacetate--CoA ligase [Litoribacillus peritrichatus]|uniref:Acetoacetate--CoA ligase n=1 Tax=Litoribacillus peritrichatus TaxID=718191 RepID=A0ABP7MKR5_9GAMM